MRKHVLTTKIHPERKLYQCRYCNNEYGTNLLKEFQGHLIKIHNKNYAFYKNDNDAQL